MGDSKILYDEAFGINTFKREIIAEFIARLPKNQSYQILPFQVCCVIVVWGM